MAVKRRRPRLALAAAGSLMTAVGIGADLRLLIVAGVTVGGLYVFECVRCWVTR